MISSLYRSVTHWLGDLFRYDESLGFTLIVSISAIGGLVAYGGPTLLLAFVFTGVGVILTSIGIYRAAIDRPTPPFRMFRNITLLIHTVLLVSMVAGAISVVTWMGKEKNRIKAWRQTMSPFEQAIDANFQDALRAEPCRRAGLVVFYRDQMIVRPGFSDRENALLKLGLELSTPYNKQLPDALLAKSPDDVDMVVMVREDLDFQGPRSTGYRATVELVDMSRRRVIYRDEDFPLSGRAGDTTFFSSTRVASLERERLTDWLTDLPTCAE